MAGVEKWLACISVALFAMFAGEMISVYYFMLTISEDAVVAQGFSPDPKLIQFVSIGVAPAGILAAVAYIMSRNYGSKQIGGLIIVAELNGKIVGSTTLLIEPKFIHNGGLVGHIEDVVVKKGFQGEKIGNKIIKHVLELAKNHGCYKTILDCSDEVKPFYEKMGFKQHSNELRFNHI